MNQEKIGNIIKNIRVQNNLSQREFAEKFGVTYQAVSKWENGKNIPDIAILKEICREYNLDLDNLLDALMNIDDKLNELQRINSMVIVTCDACENGNDIKYDVANVMVFIQEQINSLDDDIRSNVSKCNALTRNIQETIKKGDCQYGRING